MGSNPQTANVGDMVTCPECASEYMYHGLIVCDGCHSRRNRELEATVGADYIAIQAQCRTTDGRLIVMIDTVSPWLWEDGPCVRGYVLGTLARAAADGDPPGTLDESTLILECQ